MSIRLSIVLLLTWPGFAISPVPRPADQVPIGAVLSSALTANDFFSIRNFILNFGTQSTGWSNRYPVGYIYRFQNDHMEVIYVPAINDARPEILFFFSEDHSLDFQIHLIKHRPYLKDSGSKSAAGGVLATSEFSSKSKELLHIILRHTSLSDSTNPASPQ